MRPILIFGYGNPARGDDALGPELIRRLERRQGQACPEPGEGRGPGSFPDTHAQTQSDTLSPTYSHTLIHTSPYASPNYSADTTPETKREIRSQPVTHAVSLADVDLLTDFQLQPEHALDLAGRARALLVDADAGLEEPCRLEPVNIDPAPSYTTHFMTPGSLLGVHLRIGLGEPPPCHLLRIRGYRFALGGPLSTPALNNLDLAERLLMRWLNP